MKEAGLAGPPLFWYQAVEVPRIKIVAFLLFLLLAGAGRYALHRARAGEEVSAKEVLLVPPGRVIRQADLGHHNLAADLLFIRANLYYGHHILGDEQLPWLSDFIDILLEVDPHFKAAYIWGAMVTLFPRRQMDYTPPELVRRANRILEAGMQRFQDDHRFAMRLAYNHYYELGDADASIPYFERAANTPGAPDFIKQKLVDIYSHKGRAALARETLLGILAETEDPLLNRALQDRLTALMPEEDRERLLQYRQALVERWRESYPFLSLDLYLLIGEP